MPDHQIELHNLDLLLAKAIRNATTQLHRTGN